MNEILMMIIVFLTIVSRREDRVLLITLSFIYLTQLATGFFTNYYISAFIADFVILYAAKNEHTKLSSSISIISLCFMLTHAYGFIIYNLYIEPSSYNNVLSCLYLVLIYEIISNGGLWNELKRLANSYCNGAVCRARLFMGVCKGEKCQ